MKVFIRVLFFIITPVICYEGKTIKELEPNTAKEFEAIFTNKDLKANCTGYPRPSKPKYFLYNSDIREDPIELNPSNINEIKAKKKTVVIIPGWITEINNTIWMGLKEAYLQRYDANIIVVDWTKYAFLEYTLAYCGVKSHALNIADFLCALELQKPKVELKGIHIIGHNLGAQIASFVGYYTDLECDKKIGRITGLDPAGPLYDYEANSEKLSKEDALFVDIIHTNFQLGALKPTAHVDFHVNCVYDQPGCKSQSSVNVEDLISDYYCPSVRSIELMAESVNSNQLIAVSCSRCSTVCEPDILTEVYEIMGENFNSTLIDADNFLIYTYDKYPYGMGMIPYPEARQHKQYIYN